MTTTAMAPRKRRARKNTPGRDNAGENAGALDMGVLGTLIGYHLRCAQAALFQHFDAALGDYELSPPQLGALFLIDANPGISQTAVAQTLRLDRSTLVQIVDRLEARDLLRRAAAIRDRRSHALRLTEPGKRLVAELADRTLAHEAEFTRALTAEERRLIVTLLVRLHTPGDTDRIA